MLDTVDAGECGRGGVWVGDGWMCGWVMGGCVGGCEGWSMGGCEGWSVGR